MSTRLAAALRWWANNDDCTVPLRHLVALEWMLVQQDGECELNERGKEAMREHGYRETDCGAWERDR